MPTASLPLENTHDNIDGWMSVMLDPDEEGSSKLVNRIEKYSMLFLNSADIREEEDFPDFFDASESTMMVHSESKVWQYGLWSFQMGDTKLERFLPKNPHTQRKLLNFEFWINVKK